MNIKLQFSLIMVLKIIQDDLSVTYANLFFINREKLFYIFFEKQRKLKEL